MEWRSYFQETTSIRLKTMNFLERKKMQENYAKNLLLKIYAICSKSKVENI